MNRSGRPALLPWLLGVWVAVVVSLAGCGDGSAWNGERMRPLATGAGDHEAVVQHLYVAYYGRPADPAGLKFWADYLARGEAPATLSALLSAYGRNAAVTTVIDNFGRSEESIALYGSEPELIVKGIYLNLFNREPDLDGLNFYADGLRRGLISNAQVALAVANGAQGRDAWQSQGKADAAAAFTRHLSPAQVTMYSGLDANAAVREALRGQDFSNGTDTASLRLLAALDPAARFTARSSSVEDPTAYYPCTETLFLNMVDAVDLNGDGRRDLVVHYWCNQWNQTATFDGPTPNSLVVLLAQADGSYRIGNESVFGTQRVDLGGASRKSRVADFNGDGLPDILYAANREDGRPLNADASNQFAPLPVLLSQGGGRYRVEAIGPPSWYHGIDLATNEAGRFDAVAIGFGNQGTRGYRWTATGWTGVDGYPMLSGLTFSFVNEPGVQTDQVVTGGLQSAAQLQVFSKVAGAWQETSNVLFPSRKVPYLTWQGTQTEVDTISLGSDDLVAAGFDETCVMRLKPGGPPAVVARMTGVRIPGGYTPEMGTVKESSLRPYHSLLVYEINQGQLVRRDQVILGEDTTVAFNKYECRDVNGDGLADVVGYSPDSSGPPVIYLNDGNEHLVRLSTQAFPQAPGCYGGTGSRLADLNGDGIEDLILFRTSPAPVACETAPITVFYGLRRLALGG